MSNESSASETTPLRRPEEVYQDSSSTSTSVNDIVQVTRNVSTRHLLTADNANNPPSHQQPVKNTLALANHNNNKIEIRLSNSSFDQPQQERRSSSSSNRSSSTIQINYGGKRVTPPSSTFLLTMDTNKRILYRVGLDVLILLCVGFPILCFYLWGQSFKRGFFCDDESLMHPYKESTVKNWMLYFIGLVIPIGSMISVEILHAKHKEKSTNANINRRRYFYMNYEIPEWIIQCYKKIGIFGFGAAVCQITTDIAKYSIGRLRPHFFAVCQPIMPGGTTCADAINQGKYITIFNCSAVGSTARMIKESTLSFPSGHSSFTFYAMVYLALYLHSRMNWRGSKLLKHFLSFLCIMMAWYTALSRVSDYKHHWSDVLVGSLIGALIAIIVAKYISDLFHKKNHLPVNKNDIPQVDITTNRNENRNGN